MRGSQKTKTMIAPSTGVDFPAEIETPKGPKKNIISIWKCRECQFLNKLGDASECGNKKKCNYNLQYEDDLTQCIMDMDEEEFL